jgi:hypothetical protein
MEVSDQLHAPAALSKGRSLWYPLDRRLGGSQSWCGRGDEEINFLQLYLYRQHNTRFELLTAVKTQVEVSAAMTSETLVYYRNTMHNHNPEVLGQIFSFWLRYLICSGTSVQH